MIITNAIMMPKTLISEFLNLEFMLRMPRTYNISHFVSIFEAQFSQINQMIECRNMFCLLSNQIIKKWNNHVNVLWGGLSQKGVAKHFQKYVTSLPVCKITSVHHQQEQKRSAYRFFVLFMDVKIYLIWLFQYFKIISFTVA